MADLRKASVACARPRWVLLSSLGPHCVCLHWALGSGSVCSAFPQSASGIHLHAWKSTRASENPRWRLSAPWPCFQVRIQPAGQAGCLSQEPTAQELELQERRTGERFSQVLTKLWDKNAPRVTPVPCVVAEEGQMVSPGLWVS